MSGLCVVVSNDRTDGSWRLLRTAASGFVGPNQPAVSQVTDGVAMIVAGRFAPRDIDSSFGAIDEDERYVLAAEGYFADLADVAEPAAPSRGHVLIRLFHRRGPSAFHRLRGSFYVAIYDKDDRTCTIATSRFGQRSLYRSEFPGGWVFASEIKAIRAWRRRPFTLRHERIGLVFTYGAVPDSTALLDGLIRLAPGECQVVRSARVSRQLPSDDAPVAAAPLAWDDCVERTDALMRESVGRLLRVDTGPKAVLMGRGIDSAVVAGIVKQLTGSVDIVTQAMPGPMDESAGAARTARGLGASHHVFRYDPAQVDLLDALARFVRVMEEPVFWWQLGPPMMALSSSIAGVARTLFLGIIADELIEARPERSRSRRRFRRWMQVVTTSALYPGAHYHKAYFRGRARVLRASPLSRHLTYVRLNSLAQAASERAVRGPTDAHERQAVNVRTTAKLVQFTGGEALLPYLDPDVMHHFIAMPASYKADKAILRALLHRYMPPADAPERKSPFSAETVRWHCAARNVDRALDLLEDRRTRERDIYDTAVVGQLVQRFRSGTVRKWDSHLLYEFLLFELFCRQFVDGEDVAGAALPRETFLASSVGA